MNLFYTKNTVPFSENYFLEKSQCRKKDELLNLAAGNHICADHLFQDSHLDVQSDFLMRTEWHLMMEQARTAEENAEEVSIYMKSWDVLSPSPEIFVEKYMELYRRGYKLAFFDNFTLNSEYISDIMDSLTLAVPEKAYGLQDVLNIQLESEKLRIKYEHEMRSRKIRDGKSRSENKGGRKAGPRLLTDEMKMDIYRFLQSENKNIAAFLRAHDISRITFKKYVKYVEAELQTDEAWYIRQMND